MPDEPNKYQPIGKKDKTDTITIETGIFFIETITPTKLSKTI